MSDAYLRERLDQFEAYAITVDSTLRDRERVAQLERKLARMERAHAAVLLMIAGLADYSRVLAEEDCDERP